MFLQFFIACSKPSLFCFPLVQEYSFISCNCIKISHHLMICDIKSDDEKENYTSYKKKKCQPKKIFSINAFLASQKRLKFFTSVKLMYSIAQL